MENTIEKVYFAIVRVDHRENKFILEGRIDESEKEQRLDFWKNRIGHHHQTPYLIQYTPKSKEEIFKDYRDGFEKL